MSDHRIVATRLDADGGRIPCTTRIITGANGRRVFDDFRDLDGKPVSLPPGSMFEFNIRQALQDFGGPVDEGSTP